MHGATRSTKIAGTAEFRPSRPARSTLWSCAVRSSGRRREARPSGAVRSIRRSRPAGAFRTWSKAGAAPLSRSARSIASSRRERLPHDDVDLVALRVAQLQGRSQDVQRRRDERHLALHPRPARTAPASRPRWPVEWWRSPEPRPSASASLPRRRRKRRALIVGALPHRRHCRDCCQRRSESHRAPNLPSHLSHRSSPSAVR